MNQIKKALKKIFCRIIYHTGLLCLFLRCCFLKKKEFPCVIINYHRFIKDSGGILEIHPSVSHRIEDFKKEISFLKSYFDVVALDEVVDTLKKGAKFAKPTVAITVDDGFKDNYELLFPVLKEQNVPATIFLSTAVIGTNHVNWFDRLANTILCTSEKTFAANGCLGKEEFPLGSIHQKRAAYNRIVQQLKDVDITERDTCLKSIENRLGLPGEGKALMLSWDEVRTMRDANIVFGAHTHTHPILTKMPFAEAKKEIMDSKTIIEKELGVPVKHFAYPNGRKVDFNEALRSYCKENGFLSISTFDYGHNNSSSDVWSLKRIGSESPISLFAVNVVRAFLVNG